ALAGQLEGEVDLVLLIERALAGVALEQHAGDLLGVLGRQDLVAELDQVAVEAVEREVSHLEVDVRRSLLETEPEQSVQLLPFHGRSFLPGVPAARVRPSLSAERTGA